MTESPLSNELSLLVRRQAERIGESSAAALSGLYDITAQRLLRLAVAITGNQHDAEDAVQSVLVKVSERPQLLIDADHPWPYLLRMVRNAALLVVRRRKQWFPADSLDDQVLHATDTIDQQETHRAVWSALRSLPAPQSEVVVLKIWEEMTFQEIANTLAIPTATVASRYRYAIEKLSQKLAATAQAGDSHE